MTVCVTSGTLILETAIPSPDFKEIREGQILTIPPGNPFALSPFGLGVRVVLAHYPPFDKAQQESYLIDE
jgi:mannose-6-phosphate isomerase-like protein (cupin superfamily)